MTWPLRVLHVHGQRIDRIQKIASEFTSPAKLETIRPLNVKLVLKRKRGAEGEILKYKARLVVVGNEMGDRFHRALEVYRDPV
jgi:hypothetical protein